MPKRTSKSKAAKVRGAEKDITDRCGTGVGTELAHSHTLVAELLSKQRHHPPLDITDYYTRPNKADILSRLRVLEGELLVKLKHHSHKQEK